MHGNQNIGSKMAEAAAYRGIKKWEDVGYFLQAYIASGGVVTSNPYRNNRVDVTEVAFSINDAVMSREATTFTTVVPNASYYLDVTKDGDWHWSTSHPSGSAGTDYLTIATVTTNSLGNVAAITDTRGHVGGFLLKDEYGLENYATVAQLAETTELVKTGHIKRLKQPFCANAYWIGVPLVDMKAGIDQWIELGVDGIVVTIHLVYSGSTLVPSESMSDVLSAMSYAVGNGLNITCIKVHCTVANTGTFLTDYQAAVSSLLGTFSGMAPMFTILNERGDITNNSGNNAWAIALIGTVKAAGFQCGITLQDIQYYGIGDSVLTELDFIGLNCYPIIGYKGRNTTLQDCINGIDTSVIKRMLLDLKARYPSKPVIITEFGIRNYYIYYASPSDYTYDSPDDLASGHTVINYFEALFEILNGKIDGIWSWFDIYYASTVDFFQSWTGGGAE
jgi:hypothetical protein